MPPALADHQCQEQWTAVLPNIGLLISQRMIFSRCTPRNSTQDLRQRTNSRAPRPRPNQLPCRQRGSVRRQKATQSKSPQPVEKQPSEKSGRIILAEFLQCHRNSHQQPRRARVHIGRSPGIKAGNPQLSRVCATLSAAAVFGHNAER